MSDVLKENANGFGAINASLVIPDGKTYRLTEVRVKLQTAASTSENLLITLDAAAGENYDTTYLTHDPGTSGKTSIVWAPDHELDLVGGDAIDVTWTNTDDCQWGLEYTAVRVRQPC